MKRYASIWLMDWPITAWRWARIGASAPPDASDHPAPPFALVERTAAGLILHALTPQARALGLKLHQAHADACAIVPSLTSAPAEPERALRALIRLGGWMERFSPFVAMDAGHEGLEGLFIDLTGGQHLFGGEPEMAVQMLSALQRLGAPAQIGVADTPGAAWALARYDGRPIAIAAQGQAGAAIAALPVAALRLAPNAIQLLNRFGLRRIGALTGLPRAALARRFRDAEALNLLERLDQALGHVAEPLAPIIAPPVYRTQKVFFEPMTSAEVIAIEAAALTKQLAAALEADGMGARCLRLTGFRVDGRTTTLEVKLASPSRRASHLLRLLKDKGFDHLDLGFGVDALALSAPIAEPLAMTQIAALGREDQALAAAQDALIDRLSARLGDIAVLAPQLAQRWSPEAAETLKPFGETRLNKAQPDIPTGGRPILLLDPPEPIDAVAEMPDGAPARFTWRRAAHKVMRASGPERLAPEWWKDAHQDALTTHLSEQSRDYYRVEDEAGGRYWVYRKGLYDGQPGALLPSWWMHGLFP